MVVTVGTPTGYRRFFSNPVVGIVGSVASIISIPLAVFFYSQGAGKRDLVYAVYPLRTYLARAERPSELRVTFKGQPITPADVIAVQVVLWNQGDLSIKPENVLDRVELILKPPASILEASIMKQGRGVAGLRVLNDPELLKRGRAPIEFKILERGDGATVQLIYAGPRETHVELTGVVEGQGQPRNLSPEAVKEESPVDRYRAHRKTKISAVIVAAAVVVGYCALVINIIQEARGPRAAHPMKRRAKIVLAVIGLLGIAVLFYFGQALWDLWSNPTPPFAF